MAHDSLILRRVLGASQTSVARRYGVAPKTVKRWLGEARPLPAVGTGRPDLAGLIFAYVGDALQTLTAQVVWARDPDWLKQQNAADLAVLHGVMHGKLIRVLSAMRVRPAGAAE